MENSDVLMFHCHWLIDKQHRPNWNGNHSALVGNRKRAHPQGGRLSENTGGKPNLSDEGSSVGANASATWRGNPHPKPRATRAKRVQPKRQQGVELESGQHETHFRRLALRGAASGCRLYGKERGRKNSMGCLEMAGMSDDARRTIRPQRPKSEKRKDEMNLWGHAMFHNLI
ncbi:HMG (high mobility group) box domain-containing protein [Anopheles sinensis]|uniref:HMG (High mobility group) box domain-containing protein n=1 Tax=Anopheles sinensis TaxID=74873 RepID=A0A084VTH1_ANOSI|nr:HMG (high mobility group) box domain-containing protein [Anopheles sinensis]